MDLRIRTGLQWVSITVEAGQNATSDDFLSTPPIRWSSLSSGTQGNYSLDLDIGPQDMVIITNGMTGRSTMRVTGPNKPAILLIDEIENHLHPTWQRRVIPALLEHFPGLQIFATTHSPFVVAGLKAGQVHLLKRDDERPS